MIHKTIGMREKKYASDISREKFAELRVHKFHSGGLLYLLGYTQDDSVRLVYLEVVGPHENFYRDLKR